MSRLNWALRAGTERVVQPTDSRSLVGFCVVLGGGVPLKGREEVRACRRIAALRVGREAVDAKSTLPRRGYPFDGGRDGAGGWGIAEGLLVPIGCCRHRLHWVISPVSQCR